MVDRKSGSWSDSKGLARAILRDRAERRKWLGGMVLVPLAMMGLGLWVISDWIWASPWRVLFWWGGCAVATCVVVLFALYDALLAFREERSKDGSDVDLR
jgi:hypothetical protein